MKTIVAGTDFSKSSLNACRYAAMLAARLKCKLSIFNLFETPLLHSNVGVYGIVYDSMRKTGEKKMSRLVEELKELFPGLTISTFVRDRSFKEELKLFTDHHQVQAVVMGLESKTKLSKFIYGSHGVSIAGKIDAPVIIVPDNYKDHRFDNLLLAADNTEKLHKTPLKTLAKMLAGRKTHIHALHVRTAAEVLQPAVSKLAFNGKPLTIETKRAKKLEAGLKNYCRENPVDMIVMISKKHSAFYNFFAETNTKKVIFASRVPVMAIHE